MVEQEVWLIGKNLKTAFLGKHLRSKKQDATVLEFRPSKKRKDNLINIIPTFLLVFSGCI